MFIDMSAQRILHISWYAIASIFYLDSIHISLLHSVFITILTLSLFAVCVDAAPKQVQCDLLCKYDCTNIADLSETGPAYIKT